MSSTSVDFPLPETPVTQVRQPNGIDAVMFFRLFSVAPTIVSQPSEDWLLERGATRWRGMAIFATTTLDVEAETPRAVTAHPRSRQLAEQLPDRRKRPGVGDRIGARRAADRALINDDRLIDLIEPVECSVVARLVL